MGKALRLLNLQKDVSDYDLLIDNYDSFIDNYDSSDRRRSLLSVVYPRKSRNRTHVSFLRQTKPLFNMSFNLLGTPSGLLAKALLDLQTWNELESEFPSLG
jgi:hypothetical protein